MPDFSDEQYSYRTIMNRKLSMVPSDLDTREGSVLWNTLGPNSMEIANLYQLLLVIQQNQYADTADRDNLIKLARLRGLTPYPATSTIISANFYSDMTNQTPYNPASGDTFYAQNTKQVYTVTTQIADGEWRLEANVAGESGNNVSGNLIPTVAINGLAGAVFKEILIYGEDEESTEDLRARYMASLESKAYAGNKAFYREYTEAYQGVGSCRVYRAYQGAGGHVGLCITDSEYGVPTSELISAVQEYIDPSESQGEGVGVAPIDHIVTVFGVTELTINVNLNITCIEGTQWNDIKPSIQLAIENYFQELREGWADQDYIIVRASQIIARVLNVSSVLDVTYCAINGSTANIQLQDSQIPKLGTLDGSVL